MNKHLKTLFVISIISLTSISALQLFSATGEIPSREYRERMLGNNAFESGLYDVAMNYYKNYLKDAAGNSPAIRDAYFCLIATCLRSNKLDKAQSLFTELKTKFQIFFENNPEEQRVLEYWNAEILLKKDHTEKAENIFKDILANTKENEKELRTNTLIGLGIAEIRKEKWEEAKQSFVKLKEIGTGTKVEVIATQQLILINIVQGNLVKARLLLQESTKDKRLLTAKLLPLNIFTLIKEKKYSEAQQEYNHLKQSVKAPNTVWYILSLTFADSYIEIKDFKQAIPLLEDASIMAPNLYYKEKTTIKLINTLLAAGQPDKIADTAIFFLENLPNTVMKDQILLRLIEILIKEKKYTEATECASKYLTLTIPSTTDKIKIAIEIGQVLLKIKKYDKAVKYFKYAADNGTSSIEKNEGKYWYAETLLSENKFEQALVLFNELKKNTPSWKEKSTYKIAEIYLKQKNNKKAAEVLELLIAEYPKSKLQPSPLFLYAATLKNMGKIEEAITGYVNFAENNPIDKNASQAYFEAGCLSLDIGKYTQGIKYFKKILVDYKKNDKTSNVLYQLLYANYLAGNNENSAKYAVSLLKQYPDSEFALQTLFWQTNYFINGEKFKQALESLETIEKKFTKKPLIISRVLYNKAYVLNLEDKKSEALKCLSKLENDYFTVPILSKGLFLKGDILSSQGNYLDAISSYLKATQVTDNLALNIAAWGRVADCFFAKINYAKDKKDKENLLLKAVDYYNKINNEETLSPLFKIQTLYKLGKCYELLNENEKAITMYHETVYGSVLNTEQGESPNLEWFAKSGIALARLLYEKNTPIAAEAAISVLKTLIKYNIQPIQDFELRIKEINKIFKLKE